MNEISIFGKGIYRLEKVVFGKENNKGMVEVKDIYKKISHK